MTNTPDEQVERVARAIYESKENSSGWQNTFNATRVLYRGYARAAIAATPPFPRRTAPQDGWQDIATAPRDGTRVMLWMEPTPDPRYISNDPAQSVIASYVVWSERSKREGMRDGWSWYGPVRCHPTHWRPLPAPPAAELELKQD